MSARPRDQGALLILEIKTPFVQVSWTGRRGARHFRTIVSTGERQVRGRYASFGAASSPRCLRDKVSQTRSYD